MTPCGNLKVCDWSRVYPERHVEKNESASWVNEQWSTWLPAMIKADYWEYYETSDLNFSLLANGYGYSKRYFCTRCPQSGPLLRHQVEADHASHETIGVSRQWNSAGVRYNELKRFHDVSDVKQDYGSDGQVYLRLRSLLRPDRRVKSADEITCSDCRIIKTFDGRNILTTFCSVECQFSSRLPLDAAILFASMIPKDDTRVRKFHHYLDSNFVRLSIDTPVSKPSEITSMVINDGHRPAGQPPRAKQTLIQHAGHFQFPVVVSPTLSACVTAIRDMQIP